MPQPDFPITTRRLTLRRLAETDIDAFADIWSREDVLTYLYDDARDRAQVAEWLATRMSVTHLEKDNDTLMLAVVVDDVPIGWVVLRMVSVEHRCGEIGFVLHPDHHGRGYAVEAATEMLRLGFEGYDMHRIIGRLDAANTASGRALEKLGMRLEAHFRENEFVKGRWADEAVYAMLAREWRAR